MWKTIISSGLVGSILFFLALHMSAAGPARFLCGYLRTGALRGISRWRGVFAHRVVQGTFAHLGQVLEKSGLIP